MQFKAIVLALVTLVVATAAVPVEQDGLKPFRRTGMCFVNCNSISIQDVFFQMTVLNPSAVEVCVFIQQFSCYMQNIFPQMKLSIPSVVLVCVFISRFGWCVQKAFLQMRLFTPSVAKVRVFKLQLDYHSCHFFRRGC